MSDARDGEHRQAPTVGRIVHYYPAEHERHILGPGPLAAIVASIGENGRPLLVIFNPGMPTPGVDLGKPFSAEATPGHWSWPPRS